MLVSISRARALVFVVLLSLILPSGLQLGAQQKPAEDPDVLRIKTDLVQTGVTVFDKQGRFVDGLSADQFEVKVDGTPVTLSFFDKVTAGSTTEEKQLTAVAKGTSPTVTPNAAPVKYRGRMIVFFVDDMHLRAQSVTRTRKLINDFIDNQMDPDDQVAVGSPSGQIGFLSRFTEVKPVLRAAVARINHKPYTVVDAENIRMTEYQAIRIDQGDKDTTNHFVTEILKASSYKIAGGQSLGPPQGGPVNQRPDRSQERQGGLSPEMAERSVKNRAQLLLRQSEAISGNTLEALESAIRATSQLAGRKLVFFISDGFYLNDRSTGFGEKLKRITDAAVRSGVVVYSLDARGIVADTDASSNRADPFGNLSRSNIGELSASQDPLTALAGDTGGRALLNSESLANAISDALKETANYYLLAWRPPTEAQKDGNFKRIEVRIAGRPELTVRMPKGFMTGQPGASAEIKGTPVATTAPAVDLPVSGTKAVEADILAALRASTPQKGLPTQVSPTFIDVPNTGPVLNISMQMATSGLDYGPDGKQPAAIDIGGVIYNDQGKPAGSFKNRVNVNPLADGAAPPTDAGVIYVHKIPLKPGLYQVRVATRDDRSRQVGSDSRWIEIPDLASKKVTLSSLLVGGQFIGSTSQQTTSGGGSEQLQFSVDRRFARGSHLSLLTMIYNAARGGSGAPELEAQIKILRGRQPIISSPVRKLTLEAGADPARIPYGADIKLNTLAPGRYLLRVEINDRAANATASQETVFEIE